MARRSPIDWTSGRRGFESGALPTYTQVAQHLGCSREAVAARARREYWRNPERMLRETGPARARRACELFIERDARQIADRLAETAETARIGHEVVRRHLELLRDEMTTIALQRGEVIVRESPSLQLRRLTASLQSLAAVDRELAALKDAGWRTADAAAQAARERRAESMRLVRAALEFEKTERHRSLRSLGIDPARADDWTVGDRLRPRVDTDA